MKLYGVGVEAKSVNGFNAPDWMWQQITTTATKGSIALATAYLVGDIYRAVTLRANAVAGIPLHFYDTRSGDEIEEGDARLDVLGNVYDLMWKCEAALAVHGAAYIAKLDTRTETMRVLSSEFVTFDKSTYDNTGEIKFTRTDKPGQSATPNELIYIWTPSPFCEIGPGVSPLMATIEDAAVLRNISTTLAQYFGAGMIGKSVIYQAETNGVTRTPMVPEQVKSLKEFLRTMAQGVRRAFTPEVLTVPIGKLDVSDKLTEALPPELHEAQRRKSATGMGIPYSILYSDAANYATAKQDERNLYEMTLIPDVQLIQSAINAQHLNALRMEMYAAPEELAAYQEDEAERSSSLYTLVGTGVPMDAAMVQLGYDLDAGALARVQLAALMKEGATYDAARGYILANTTPESIDAATAALDILAPQAAPVEVTTTVTPTPPEVPEPEPQEAEGDKPDAVKADLDRWERKALKRLKATKSAACEFDSEHLDAARIGAVFGALQTAESADDVRRVFRDVKVWGDYPVVHLHA